MIRTVHLHGALGERFGKSYEFDIATVPEAIRALSANFVGFSKEIGAGAWHVVVGKGVDTGLSLDEDEIAGFNVGGNDIHIIPALIGAKNGGVLKLVLGVALIGLSFGFAGVGMLTGQIAPALFGGTTWAGAMSSIGFSLALAGASSLLAPQNKTADDTKSFTLTGPQNDTREGAIVPIGYGRVICGGVMISGSLYIDQTVKNGVFSTIIETVLDGA